MAVTYASTPPPAATSPRQLRHRLVPPFPGSVVWGWLGPIAITLLGGWLRFDRLSIPSTDIFDEVYYRHDAWSFLKHGVELGTVNPITYKGAEYIVHPPVGKWMIAVGEAIFGFNSTGWRFSAAVIGTLSILIVARIARRMTRSTLLGCVAGLLMCLDGLEFVQSRTGMLDIFLMFWLLVAFGCLILDRDQVRGRLARAAIGPLASSGPKVGMRWWLLASGVSTGLAMGSKWDGLYYLPAFAILAFAWSMGARRVIGVREPFWATLRRDTIPVAVNAVVLPVVVYVITWVGWFFTKDGYDRAWANHRSSTFSFVPAALRSWVHYQWQIWQTDKDLTSYHEFRSNGWGWLFETRPVLYYADYPHAGALGCTTGGSGCARMIYDMGTPAIWWASIPVMCFMVYLVFRRDWRASAVVLPFLFGYIPWLFIFKRTMFYFYVLPLLPFVCIALALTIGYLLGPPDASPNRRMIGTMIGGAYLLVVVVMFFYFLPVMTAKTIPFTDWQNHMWFQSWGESKGS